MIQSLKWRNVGNANLIGRISADRRARKRLRARHRRQRVGRRVQVDQRRRHLDADLRQLRRRVDRRRRDQPEESRHHLGRHRRGMRAQLGGVGRRHLQVDRRRQDLHAHGAEGLVQHRHHPPAPDRPQHRLRRGDRQHLRARAAIAASSRRSTAARPGRSCRTTCRRTTNGPARSKRAWIRPTRTRIYVGFWERKRTAWQLDSGGANGGIFKTTDGGKTFKKLTKGLPTGKTGKIGLAVARSNPKVVMAHIEAEYPARGRTRPTSPT